MASTAIRSMQLCTRVETVCPNSSLRSVARFKMFSRNSIVSTLVTDVLRFEHSFTVMLASSPQNKQSFLKSKGLSQERNVFDSAVDVEDISL